MADKTTPENPLENTKQERQVQNIWQSIKSFLRDLMDIREDTDHEATIQTIREDIPMRGHTAWILVFAILIASIGLNVNSTAVVIGAMLISPLMGPIIGLGMGTAINDATMLRRSLINLAVMIGISVITAFIYFSLTPLKDLTDELDARTYPTLLDVLIAISGGLALIIARTKKGTIASVLVGVAIATALMPPLCTAGYGLAIGNLGYFLGAMYLFSINTVYIALSAYVVARILKFPMAKYANQARRKTISRWATLIGLTVLIPSLLTFANLLREQIFRSSADTFITQQVDYPGASIFRMTSSFDDNTIDVYLFGKVVPPEILESWQSKIKSAKGLEETRLIIHQGDQGDEQAEAGEIEKAYISSVDQLNNAENEIDRLQKQVAALRNRGIPTRQIFNEAKPIFPNLKQLSISQSVVSDFNKVDTLTVFEIAFWDSIPEPYRVQDEQRLKGWLKQRLALDTMVVKVK